ncbi:hypothetical protein GLOIN_2v1788173 [Rhizophagus clarus]|uniref:Uncharacterized protein n=1 Tax=Rhizophagus clarus TaxID=94130 RepID=A0A8H3QNR4_9GLOM|nr:hypothetical protein GLOIN_2v1788173 [Rhizophagus clarus]
MILKIFEGIAHNAVQLESALLNCKRKASEMEEGDVFAMKTFGIITDAESVVVYGTESTEGNVERVLGHIVLEEAQKPDSDSRSEERVIKSIGH